MPELPSGWDLEQDALAALPASREAVPNLIAALRQEDREGQPTNWIRRAAARQLGAAAVRGSGAGAHQCFAGRVLDDW